MKHVMIRHRQRGAALIVGLILLVVITVLAISGMNTATTELAMARNHQNYENAFQAAETGLETALAQGFFPYGTSTALPQYVSDSGHEYVDARIDYEGWTAVPDAAFSLGVGTGAVAHHYVAVAQAVSARDPGNTSDRDASAVHTQAFYVIGAEPNTIQP
ncbi:MAG: pilus assembly PilX N-terminal domain-containing protein [Woeseiaceae bacterium]|nr:pilus assembly PilX N-terminal domain-containing protein [Woeseiaceae bacterium]